MCFPESASPRSRAACVASARLRAACIASALACALAAGCTLTPKVPHVKPAAPWVGGQPSSAQPISRLALINVTLDHEIEIDDEEHWRIGRLVEERLREKGFDVVPYDESVRLFFDKGLELGGFFDAQTGEYYEKRWDEAFEYLVAEYAIRAPIDAVVMASVDLEPASFTEAKGVAFYCNTAQVLRDYAINFMEQITMASFTSYLNASCLTIRIVSLDRRPLYVANGGIEAHGMLSPAGIQAIPKDKLLTDDERIRAAADLAARGLDAPFVR